MTAMKRIAVVPGDGIGKEVVSEVLKVLDLLRGQGANLQWEIYPFGADRYLETGQTITEEEIDALGAHDAILMGAFGDPRIPENNHARDILLGTRSRLDLYVNERPVRLYGEGISPLRERVARDMDFVILRENCEGAYVGAGGFLRRGSEHEVAVGNIINTRRGVERMVRHAFRIARERGASTVTLGDKHNALLYTGRLWNRTFFQVSREFPEIRPRHMYIDSLCMKMVLDPASFEVVVTANLFGDILSDLGAALAGGPGLAPSANRNPETGVSMFEPVHGSAPDITGTDRANPMAALLSGAMMLDHLGMPEFGVRVEDAVRACIQSGRVTTDLGGEWGTRAVGDAVCGILGEWGG